MKRRREPIIAVLVLALAGLAVAGVYLAFPPAAPPPTLPLVVLPEPPGRLTAARQADAELLEGFSPGVAGEEVLRLFREFNRAEDGCGEDVARAEYLGQTRAAVASAARAYFAAHGRRGYRALGRIALARFEELLDALVAAGGELDARAEAIAHLTPWAGDFLAAGRAAGLLGGGADGPLVVPRGHRVYIRAAYLARWAALLEPRYPVDELMGKADRATLLRWRVSRSPHPDLPQRLGALSELAMLDPTVPAHYVAGLILALGGKLEDAVPELEKSIRQDETEMAPEALRWVRARLEEQEAKGGREVGR